MGYGTGMARKEMRENKGIGNSTVALRTPLTMSSAFNKNSYSYVNMASV